VSTVPITVPNIALYGNGQPWVKRKRSTTGQWVPLNQFLMKLTRLIEIIINFLPTENANSK